MDGSRKEFRMVIKDGSHYGIILETRNRGDKDIQYLEEKENLTYFSSIRKVHEVNNYKGSDQLVSAYSRAEWMSPEVSNVKMIVVKQHSGAVSTSKQVLNTQLKL